MNIESKRLRRERDEVIAQHNPVLGSYCLTHAFRSLQK